MILRWPCKNIRFLILCLAPKPWLRCGHTERLRDNLRCWHSSSAAWCELPAAAPWLWWGLGFARGKLEYPSQPQGSECPSGWQALPPRWWHLDHLDLAKIFDCLPLFDLILLISRWVFFKEMGSYSKHLNVFSSCACEFLTISNCCSRAVCQCLFSSHQTL